MTTLLQFSPDTLGPAADADLESSPFLRVRPDIEDQLKLDFDGNGKQPSPVADAVPDRNAVNKEPSKAPASKRKRPRGVIRVVVRAAPIYTLRQMAPGAGVVDPIVIPANARCSDKLLLALICLMPPLVSRKGKAYTVVRGGDLIRHVARHPDLGPDVVVPVIVCEPGPVLDMAACLWSAAVRENIFEIVASFLRNPDEVSKHFRIGRQSPLADIAVMSGVSAPTLRKIQQGICHEQ